MGGLITGVVSGGALSLLTLFALGVLHHYVFGPAVAPFGDPDFFSDMSVWGLVVLVLIRFVAGWIGSWTAVKMSGEPHATWTGPAFVMGSALVTAFVMGMSQPWWSLLLSLVAVLAAAFAVGRAHAGLPILPGLPDRGDQA